jgi:formylmethanofuran dehydrogenase subunit C
MKIVVDGEFEEFLPADDEKMDELTKIVEARFEAFEEEDEEGEEED